MFGLHFALTGFSGRDIAPVSANWGRLDRDGSVSEMFEYAQLTVAACVLARVCMVRQSFVLAPFVLIILYLILDNALEFHESFATAFFPRYQNVGELLFMMLAGLVFAATASIGFMKATERERIEITAVSISIVLLGIAATGIDALHAIVPRHYPLAERPLVLIEDGGELIAQSILLAVCVRIWLIRAKSDSNLQQAVDGLGKIDGASGPILTLGPQASGESVHQTRLVVRTGRDLSVWFAPLALQLHGSF